MVADRNFKLIGDKVADFLQTPRKLDSTNNIATTQVCGAPDGQKNQNGAIETIWKKIMCMARSWLASNLLLTRFWYFAIRQAVQVHNYSPIHIDGRDTTPHEMMYGYKPDYRNLMPMFLVAYIKRKRDGKKHRSKAMSQTIQGICMGNDPQSDGRLFYIPQYKSLVVSADYILDPISGPICNLEYDGGIQFNFYSEGNKMMSSPAYKINDTVQCLPTGKYAVVTKLDFQGTDFYYRIKYLTSGTIVTREESELSDVLATESAPNIANLPWVKDNNKVTVYFPSFMKCAKQGYLRRINNSWEIHIRSSIQKAKKLHIPSLNQNFTVYIAEQKIIASWKRHSHMQQLLSLQEKGEYLLHRLRLLHSSDPTTASSQILQHT